jgi:ribonuclease-3
MSEISIGEAVVALESELGITFSNRELLLTVFVHRSYLNEHRTFPLPHNERLEFLGDAVLELSVTDLLYRKFPDKPEGELTALRSAVVRGDALSEVARLLGFSKLLLLSNGEERSGGREKGYLLANALEAFIGALYLDQGYDVADAFVKQHVLAELDAIVREQRYIDPKSRLQEYTQSQTGLTPRYEVREESGPDHAKTFTVAVFVGDSELAVGTGSSKQGAQVAAAEAALANLATAQ